MLIGGEGSTLAEVADGRSNKEHKRSRSRWNAFLPRGLKNQFGAGRPGNQGEKEDPISNQNPNVPRVHRKGGVWKLHLMNQRSEILRRRGKREARRIRKSWSW